jgi:subtilisin family serine protease
MKKALTAACVAAVAATASATVAQAAVTPNDALYGRQWALPKIQAPAAWDRTSGSPNVKVAVVDSGVTMSQPDLAPSIWHNPGETGAGKESNGIDDDHNGFVDDWRGWDFVQNDNDPSDNFHHGTEVAGVIAARANNGIGIAGVAPGVTIIPVRVLDNLNTTTCNEGAQGLAYAVKAGAQIVNFSVGTAKTCQPQSDVIQNNPNVLFVVAAMNDGSDNDQRPVYPCNDPAPNVICVAATDANDQLWNDSNFGAQSVDLAAPGVDILSTYLKYGPRETIFEDGFETDLDINWLPGTFGNWATTKEASHTGSWSLTDSPGGNFANNANLPVYLMDPLHLEGKSNCWANVYIKRDFSPFPSSWQGSDDDILSEATPDGVHWGRRKDGFIGGIADWELWQIDLSELENRFSIGEFRFRLQTDEVGAFDGVHLDDFKIYCQPPLTNYTGANDEFDPDSGTSFAAPQVAGVAALLLSLNPNLSPTDVKQRILSSVDPVPGLAGKVATGGRLDAAKAVATIPPPAPPANPAAVALAADLKALMKKLRGRALLHGAVAARVHAPGAGRLTLVVKSGKRTVASGTRTVKRGGAYVVRVHATRSGRVLLRHHRHLKVTVALRFKPRSGPLLVQSSWQEI